jgi:hypothetical protein
MSTSTSALGPAAELGDVLARFPLVPHAKPPCRPLETRIRRVRDLVHKAEQQPAEALLRAAEAFNLAALILSDCGMPDLARTLCRQQFAIFQAQQPYDAPTAKLALQPLINLGRLHIRDGDADAAYNLLTAIFDAVKTRTDAVIDNQAIPLGDLADTEDARRIIVKWLWTVLLSDTTRALTRAGRWEQALAHVHQHNGVGQRLLDGRQVAIIAAATTGNHQAAHELVKASDTPNNWEQAVAPCLTFLCRRIAHQPTQHDTTAMAEQFLALEPSPDQAVFQIRLGLAGLDLAQNGRHASQVAEAIINHAENPPTPTPHARHCRTNAAATLRNPPEFIG